MKRIIKLIFVLIFLNTIFFYLPADSNAFNKTADSSASFILGNGHRFLIDTDFDLKKIQILRTLNYVFKTNNSPLVGTEKTFLEVCLRFNFDCYFLPAIAWLESSLGKFIVPNSYNPFGWGKGYIFFDSWDEAIKKVGQKLSENYVARGLTTIEKIGRVYCENPTWAEKITFLMNRFYQVEDSLGL